MGAAVVAGVDAPPVFKAPEHVLELVALAVERGVVGDMDFPITLEGMQAAMPRAARAWRNQSASYPRSPSRTLAGGMASNTRAAPL